MLTKTLEFYKNIDDELETEAAENLQMYCKSRLTAYFGPEAMGVLKSLRDAQAPNEQLFAKFNEFVLELPDNQDQSQVLLVGMI